MSEPIAADLGAVRRVAVASMLGTAIEWYDYFAYGIVAALIFDKLFFPSLSPTAGAVAALASFAVGFIARPFGAVVFGHLGDRIGRRATLVVTVILIGLSSGAIGLLPTFDQIGVAAPVLLVTLRILEGLSVGGEWSGAVLMSVEHAPPGSRSFYGSMPQYGSPLGTLGSSGVVALVVLLPPEAFAAWGWRIPFLLALPMTAIALYLRLRINESPEFKHLTQTGQRASAPVIEAIRSAWPRMLAGAAACLFASGAFYLLTTFLVHFGTRNLGVSEEWLLAGTMLGAVLEAVGIFIGGWAGDRFGPARVVVAGCALMVMLAWPLMIWVGSADPLAVVLGMGLAIGLVGIPYGPMGAMMANAFAARSRYSAVAVSYNVAGMVGGLVPSLTVAVVAALNGAIAAVAALLAAIMLISTIGAMILIYVGTAAEKPTPLTGTHQV